MESQAGCKGKGAPSAPSPALTLLSRRSTGRQAPALHRGVPVGLSPTGVEAPALHQGVPMRLSPRRPPALLEIMLEEVSGESSTGSGLRSSLQCGHTLTTAHFIPRQSNHPSIKFKEIIEL